MNFITKFLEKRFVSRQEFETELTKVQDVAAQAWGESEFFDLRLSVLEDAARIVPFVSNDEVLECTTTDAVIDILTKEKGKKLHYSKIYENIKHYKLLNPNVTIQSVKATLYALARQKRISLHDGTEPGMFFIGQKKGS